MTKLTKQFMWYKWTPHKGRYARRTVYVSIVTSPRDTRETVYGTGAMGAILATYTNDKLYMHKGQITEYQFENNTRPLNNWPSEENMQLVEDLDEKFEEYRVVWENKRLVKDAKKLLMK